MPNYARLFAEAIEDSQRDYYSQHPELMVEGYWLIRHGKRTPLLPARTFLCDHEPGNPENILDRWPYMVGEIADEPVDPLDIFCAKERQVLRPILSPSGHIELTVEQHYKYRIADLRHAQEWRPQDPLAQPRRRINLTKMESLF